MPHSTLYFFFFFNDTATTEIYTLSLHDALPILESRRRPRDHDAGRDDQAVFVRRDPAKSRDLRHDEDRGLDRKSTRLNSSHANISYAVFCLKKKKKKHTTNLSPAHKYGILQTPD